MKVDDTQNLSVQPQPKYQEQFTLHRTAQAADTAVDKPNGYQPSTELLTDFNNSRPQSVHYAEQTPKYNGSAQLNNALKTYLAPLRDQPANFSVDESIEPVAKVDEFPLGIAIAQLHGIYILAQNTEGLIIVDMHAAHERILLQQMKNAWDKPEFWTSQQLLIPKVISISRMQAVRVEDLKPQLERLGLEIDLYGDEQVIVRGVPAILQKRILKILFPNFSMT